MANGVSIEQLEEIIESEGVPQRVSNRILYAAIMQQTKAIKAFGETVEDNQTAIQALERRMTEREKDRSIIWHLRNQPVETIKSVTYLVGALSAFGYLIRLLTVAAAIP